MSEENKPAQYIKGYVIFSEVDEHIFHPEKEYNVGAGFLVDVIDIAALKEKDAEIARLESLLLHANEVGVQLSIKLAVAVEALKTIEEQADMHDNPFACDIASEALSKIEAGE